MKSKLQLVVRRRGILFGTWLALVIASGATLPAKDVSLSAFSSVLILCSGMATVLLGISLAAYLVSLWKSFTSVADRFDFVVSLGLETVAGVPIMLVCLVLPVVGACELLGRLSSFL